MFIKLILIHVTITKMYALMHHVTKDVARYMKPLYNEINTIYEQCMDITNFIYFFNPDAPKS